MAAAEKPQLASSVLASEAAGASAAAGVASSAAGGVSSAALDSAGLEASLTGGRGGSTTFATSRGGSGACACGWSWSGVVFSSSPGLAGKIENSLLISLQGLPANVMKR